MATETTDIDTAIDHLVVPRRADADMQHTEDCYCADWEDAHGRPAVCPPCLSVRVRELEAENEQLRRDLDLARANAHAACQLLDEVTKQRDDARAQLARMLEVRKP